MLNLQIQLLQNKSTHTGPCCWIMVFLFGGCITGVVEGAAGI